MIYDRHIIDTELLHILFKSLTVVPVIFNRDYRTFTVKYRRLYHYRLS